MGIAAPAHNNMYAQQPGAVRVESFILAMTFGYGGKLRGINTGCCPYIRTLCASAGEHQADRAKETGNPTRGLSHRTGILERNVDEQLELLVCTADAQKKEART